MSGDENVERVLAEHGVNRVADGDGIHSWRCAYYLSTDGPCDCLDTLLADIATLKAQWQAEALRDAKLVIRGEGEPEHSGEMVAVSEVELLLDDYADYLLDRPAAALLAPTRPLMVCPGCGHELYLDPMDGWRNDSDGFTCVTGVHTDHIALLAPTTENGETE
jgi:hypothetical protein